MIYDVAVIGSGVSGADKPLPKPLIPALLNTLYKMKVSAPKAMGDIIIANYQDTGVNIIATETLFLGAQGNA